MTNICRRTSAEAVAVTLASLGLLLLWFWPLLDGQLPASFDWPKEVWYAEQIQSSFHRLTLPRVVSEVPAALQHYPALNEVNVGDSLFNNPEVPFMTPATLAFIMGPGLGYSLYFILHFLILIFGAMSLCSHINASKIGVFWLLTVIAFHPWLFQHLLLGYTPWINVCYLPLIGSLQMRKKVWQSGFLLGLLVYSGAAHLFVWTIMGVILIIPYVMLRNRSRCKAIILMLIWGLVFAAPRLVAAVLTSRELLARSVSSSYAGAADLAGILIDGRTDPFLLPASYSIYGVNFYDGSFYLGISGVVVIVSHLLIRPVSCSLDAAQRFYIGASLFFVLYLASGTVWSTVSSLLPVAATEIYPWRFIVVGWWLIGAYFLDQTFSDFENQPNLTASNAPTNRTHSEGNVSPERQVLSNHKISLLLTSLVVFANSADLRNFQLSKFPESW